MVPIESLLCAPNDQNSELAELWADRNVSEWAETPGIECPEHTPGIVGVFVCLLWARYSVTDNHTPRNLSARCIKKQPRATISGDKCNSRRKKRKQTTESLRPLADIVDNLFSD